MAEVKDIKAPESNYKPKDSKEKKVISTGKIKEKTFWARVKDSFISDEVHDVKSYLVFDIAIPAVKRTLRSLLVNTVDMTLFGKPMGDERKSEQRGGSTYIAYDRAYDRAYGGGPARGERQKSNNLTVGIRELDRVIFNEKSDAIDVLSFLFDNIEEYGVASVADFLAAANVEVTPIAHKWAWTDLRGASVEECPDGSGYYIRFPKTKPI